MQERRQNAIRLIFDFLFCRWQTNEKKLCVAAAGRAGIFSSFNHRLAAQLIINANRETLMQIYSCRYNPLHFITVYQVFTIQFVDNKTKITTLL